MNYREMQEQFELENLSKYASKNLLSKGRFEEEEKCVIRTDFQRDKDRIIHSKAFRRLKYKTQVYIAPKGDHYRTRLTHTLEVAQIGRTIARALKLNEDLVEAMCLGHDLGHTPFGHIGEDVLNKLNPKGFKHYNQSLKICEYLEPHKNLYGMNLTWEVKDGIVNHTGDAIGSTLEAKILKYADRIAYINHDIDDAIRAGLLDLNDIPTRILKNLGYSHGERINTLILAVVENSYQKDFVEMKEDIHNDMLELREFMFENVYYNEKVRIDAPKAEHVIVNLYEYYKSNMDKISKEHLSIYNDNNPYTKDASIDDIVCDYIACMTDRYAVSNFENIFLPKKWL